MKKPRIRQIAVHYHDLDSTKNTFSGHVYAKQMFKEKMNLVEVSLDTPHGTMSSISYFSNEMMEDSTMSCIGIAIESAYDRYKKELLKFDPEKHKSNG